MMLLLSVSARCDTPVLADHLQIEVLNDEVLAIDARSGGQLSAKLGYRERAKQKGTFYFC